MHHDRRNDTQLGLVQPKSCANYIIRFLDIERTIIVLTNLGPIEPVYRPPGLRGPGA
jgi:hypothetical protein